MDDTMTRIIEQIDAELEKVAERAGSLGSKQNITYQQCVGMTRGLERARRIVLENAQRASRRTA